ncbi:hypothetical protein CASFOL_010136 [Castilleja foliolosa]|uniref:Uncharacterized protein n=1 Tax=Castilleja foliolosa TaxID=1961234 RepID=A0ABD3DT67_9LAMI
MKLTIFPPALTLEASVPTLHPLGLDLLKLPIFPPALTLEASVPTLDPLGLDLLKVQNRSNPISQTAVVSLIRNNKVFSVAEGLSVDGCTLRGLCGTLHKVRKFGGKYAAAYSGDCKSAKSLFHLMNHYSSKYEFADLCDAIKEYTDKWSAGQKGKPAFPCDMLIIGFDEIRKCLVMDRVVRPNTALDRVKYTHDGECCFQGSGKEFAEKQFKALWSLRFFTNANDDKILQGLRSCILAACLYSFSCGGWLTECIVQKDKEAELFEQEHVINLLKDHYDLLIIVYQIKTRDHMQIDISQEGEGEDNDDFFSVETYKDNEKEDFFFMETHIDEREDLG